MQSIVYVVVLPYPKANKYALNVRGWVKLGMGNESLDYEKMFMALRERFESKIQEQEIYFTLLKEINKLKPYSDLINTKMYDLKIYEQCAIFKHLLEINRISKKLCERYGWDDEIQTEEG